MLDLRFFLPKRVPLPIIAVGTLALVGSWVPLAVILHYTQIKHDQPRVHMFLDMDNQPKFKAQAPSPVFNDGRAMRQPVAGTIARGHLASANGGPLQDGYVQHGHDGEHNDEHGGNVTFVTGFPEGLVVDDAFLVRGQQQFNVSCTPCHGKAGMGDGPVNQRAMSLQAGDSTLSAGTSWTPAKNLVEANEDGSLALGEATYPNGEIFNVITHGKGGMAAQGHRLNVEDRWAIVAYVRALQLSQNPQ
ncbi:MAG: cytochrome c [Algisphaera sp.]